MNIMAIITFSHTMCNEGGHVYYHDYIVIEYVIYTFVWHPSNDIVRTLLIHDISQLQDVLYILKELLRPSRNLYL